MKKLAIITLCFSFFSIFAQEKQDSIIPKVVFYSQENVKYHQFIPDTFTQNAKELIFWDEADLFNWTFVRTLGQIGKPHQIYKQGLPIVYNNDPFTGQNQLYFWDIERQFLFLNTKTSFIRAKFNQSGHKTQNLGLILSRNITPFWNFTLKSQRRTAVGAYLNNITDHWNIHFNTSFLSRNQRHFACLATMFHELKDNLNGGTFQDSSFDFNNSFNKNAQPVLFSDFRWIRNEKSIFSRYSFLFAQDSFLLSWALQFIAGYQWYKWSILDESVDSEYVAKSILYNPFGDIFPTRIFHWYELQKYFGKIILVTQNTKFQNHLACKIIDNQYKGNLSVSFQRNICIENHTRLNVHHFYLNAQQILQTSNLFNLHQQHLLNVYFQNNDSLKSVLLSFYLNYQNINPTLRDRFSTYEYFKSNQNLRNQQILTFEGQTQWDKRYLGLSLKLYFHQLHHAIFFSSSSEITQTSKRIFLTGSEFLVHYRWKSFYTRADANFYVSNPSINGLTDRMPHQIITWCLGYKKRHFKNAIELNFEFNQKVLFKTQAYLFNYAGFFWYPYNKEIQNPVIIGDMMGSAKFKKAIVFIRLNNLWDNIFFVGYYTTFYHPMPHRTLNFGIIWDFTD